MKGTNLRFVNTLIMSIFTILGLTGLYGLVWPFPSFIYDIHRIFSWAFIVLIPWKIMISMSSIKRGLDRRFDRNVIVIISIIFGIATLLLLAFGLIWKWNIGEYYLWIGNYGFTAIGWHWGVAIGTIPFFLIHLWRRWPRPKRRDFTERRQALKLLGLGAAGLIGWSISESVAKFLQGEENSRRFTGSRERGSFTGLDFPVTSGSDQGKIKLDPEIWNLQITGAVNKPLTLTYQDLLSVSTSELVATLDCTGGWYTTQIWRGPFLISLLNHAEVQSQALGIVLRGVLDYSAQYTFDQAKEILLATSVGDQILNHVHGFPLRAVVPSRRGWHWVKWMTEIEVIAI